MKTISRLEVLHAWKTVTFLNSCHVCPNNTSMPHNLSTLLLSSFRCFIEHIFGGGWCILGETALENSLQSNKLVDRKARSKVYKPSTNTLYWLATKRAISYIHSTKDILLSLPFPLLTSPIITCPAWFRTVIPLTTLSQVETPITRMLTCA